MRRLLIGGACLLSAASHTTIVMSIKTAQRDAVRDDADNASSRDFAQILAERSEHSIGALLRRHLDGTDELCNDRRNRLRAQLLRAADRGETRCTLDLLQLLSIEAPLHDTTLQTLRDQDAQAQALEFVAHEALHSQQLQVQFGDFTEQTLPITFDWSLLTGRQERALFEPGTQSCATTTHAVTTARERDAASVVAHRPKPVYTSIGVVPRHHFGVDKTSDARQAASHVTSRDAVHYF
mgnify:CR=1 FL=1